MYAAGRVRPRGFAVGVVARKKIVDGTRVTEGDVAIGLPSSGLHSNGYSLARKALLEAMKLPLDATPRRARGQDGRRGAARPDAPLRAPRAGPRYGAGVDVRAMSHITGGGLPGNLPRVLPEGLGVRLEQLWPRAPIFDLIARGARVDEAEMRRTFNLGVGFVFVVGATDAGRATEYPPRPRRSPHRPRSDRRASPPIVRSKSASSGPRDRRWACSSRGAGPTSRPSSTPWRRRSSTPAWPLSSRTSRAHERSTARARRGSRPSSWITRGSPIARRSTRRSSKSCGRARSTSSSSRASCAS